MKLKWSKRATPPKQKLQQKQNEKNHSFKFGQAKEEKAKKEKTLHKTEQNTEKKNFAEKHQSVVHRFSLTVAVVLIVISAYLGIHKVAENQYQDVILPVTDQIEDVVQEPKIEVVKEEQAESTTEEENTSSATGQLEKGNEEGETPSINSDQDYFINYRLERERIRSEQLELLQQMIDHEDTLPEVKKEAEEKVLAITKGIEEELLLESLLVAKYGGEAVVFVQADKVNVVLEKNENKMTENEADKIAQLVDTYTGVGYENAIIVIKE